MSNSDPLEKALDVLGESLKHIGHDIEAEAEHVSSIFETKNTTSKKVDNDDHENGTIMEILGDILGPKKVPEPVAPTAPVAAQTAGYLSVDTTSATSLVNPGQIGGGMNEDYYKLKYLKYKTKVMKLRSQM